MSFNLQLQILHQINEKNVIYLFIAFAYIDNILHLSVYVEN